MVPWIPAFAGMTETAEPGQLGIDGEARVFVDSAVVFVETESGRVEGSRGEIAANVFVSDAIEFGVRF